MEKRRYSDRREYLIQAVKKRRRTVRLKAIQFKGNVCSKCGYSRCIKLELEKCILVCSNCHRELHAAQRGATA